MFGGNALLEDLPLIGICGRFKDDLFIYFQHLKIKQLNFNVIIYKLKISLKYTIELSNNKSLKIIMIKIMITEDQKSRFNK